MKKLMFYIILIIAFFLNINTLSGSEIDAPETYTIEANAIGPGEISPSGSVTVSEGEDITFWFTPQTGCSIEGDGLTVDGSVVRFCPSRWTFENVSSDHTISINFHESSPIVQYTTLEDRHLWKTGDPVPENCINPDQLEYMGAFRLPSSGSGDAMFAYGGRDLAFYPDGDPAGIGDGYSGSLFVLGHQSGEMCAEISIPEPVISPDQNLSDLPVAEFIQNFTDIFEGDLPQGNLLGIEYLPQQQGQNSDKIYFANGNSYYPVGDFYFANHGWSDIDLSLHNNAGPWYIGSGASDLNSVRTGYSLCTLPDNVADQLGGRALATGRYRAGHGRGPNLYAIAPWQEGNPPESDAGLSYLPLLGYDVQNYDHMVNDYRYNDFYSNIAWVNTAQRSAMLISAYMGYGNIWYDHNMYSDYSVAGIKFYNTADLLAVARGEKESWEPQPYATLNVSDKLFSNIDHYRETTPSGYQFYVQKSGQIFGGTIDRENNLLYIAEAAANQIIVNVVHVWKINNETVIEPPTPPSVLQHPISQAVSSGGSVTFAVTADGTLPLSYQWYKDENEISGATSNTYTIDSVQDIDEGKYYVEVTNEAGSEISKEATLIVNDSLPQVENLECLMDLNTAYINWTNPVNHESEWDRVLVIRREGTDLPENQNDGLVVYDGEGNSAVDNNLADGEYIYAVYVYKETETNDIYYEPVTETVNVTGQSNKSVLRIEADEENSIVIGQNTRGDLYSLWNSEKNTIGIGQTGNETGLWLYSELAGNLTREIPADSEIISARLVFSVEDCIFNYPNDNSKDETGDFKDMTTVISDNAHSINIYQIKDPDNLGMPYYSDQSGIRNGLDFNYRDHRPGVNKPWVIGEDDNTRNTSGIDGNISKLLEEIEPIDSIEFSPVVFEDELVATLQFDITTAVKNWAESSGEDGENQGLYIKIGEGWENGENISLYGVTAEENQKNISPYIEIIYGNSGDLTEPRPVDELKVNPETSDDNAITLNWNNPEDNDLVGIKIVRQEEMLPYNERAGEHTAIVARDNSNNIGNTYTDSGLDSGKAYFYAVYAYDSQHNYSEPVYLKAIPGNIAEAPEVGNPSVGDGEVSINWSPMDEADTYHIYRKDNRSQIDSSDEINENPYNRDGLTGYRLIAEIEGEQSANTVSFTDYLLIGKYSYRIAAVNENGDGQLSDEISIEIDKNNAAASFPAAPVISEQESRAISGSEIELQWIDLSDNESLFIIEREMEEEVWQEVGQVYFDEVSFTDQGLLPVTEYTYRIKAVNSAGKSTSNKINITTPDEVVVIREINWEVISASQVKVEWEDMPNEDGYIIEVLDGDEVLDGEDEVLESQELPSDLNYFYLVALEPDREYRVRITTVIGNDTKSVMSDIIRTSMDLKGGLF